MKPGYPMAILKNFTHKQIAVFSIFVAIILAVIGWLLLSSTTEMEANIEDSPGAEVNQTQNQAGRDINIYPPDSPDTTVVELIGNLSFKYFRSIGLNDFETHVSRREGSPNKVTLGPGTRWFGFEPIVTLAVNNKSNRNISIRGVTGFLRCGTYRTNSDVWKHYYRKSPTDIQAFPLLVQSHEEIVISFPLIWPVSDSTKRILEQMKTDSLYRSKDVERLFTEPKGVFSFGPLDASPRFMKQILIEDLHKITDTLPTDTVAVYLDVYTADDERFSTTIVLN